jgi:hypothetical protein
VSGIDQVPLYVNQGRFSGVPPGGGEQKCPSPLEGRTQGVAVKNLAKNTENAMKAASLGFKGRGVMLLSGAKNLAVESAKGLASSISNMASTAAKVVGSVGTFFFSCISGASKYEPVPEKPSLNETGAVNKAVTVGEDRMANISGFHSVYADYTGAFKMTRENVSPEHKEKFNEIVKEFQEKAPEIQNSNKSPEGKIAALQKAGKSCIKKLEKEVFLPEAKTEITEDALQAGKEIGKELVAPFAKEKAQAKAQQVRDNVLLQRGLNAPDSVTKKTDISQEKIESSEAVGQQQKTVPLKETVTTVDTSMGKGYLDQTDRAASKEHYPEVSTGTGEHGKILQRVSAAKKAFQGVSMNCEKHVVQYGDKTVSMLRSGAQCTHGRKPATEKLFAQLEQIEQEKGGKNPTGGMLARAIALDKKGGLSSADQKVVDEVKLRTRLGIAQALPKIGESVLLSLNKMATVPDAGFLHTEVGLVSTHDKKERQMALEVREVFAGIEDLQVQFVSEGEGGVEVGKNGQVTMKLVAPESDKNKVAEGSVYKVTTAFVLEGVNEQQSMGNFFGRGGGAHNQLQEDINIKGAEKIKGYVGTNKAEDLDAHLQSNKREVKDKKFLDLVQDATREAGGTAGIFCKSGKDRTGMYMSEEASRQLGGDEAPSLGKRIKEKLVSGLSHYLTGINTGAKRGYAFNPFQRASLPDWLRPPARLCDKVDS